MLGIFRGKPLWYRLGLAFTLTLTIALIALTLFGANRLRYAYRQAALDSISRLASARGGAYFNQLHTQGLENLQLEIETDGLVAEARIMLLDQSGDVIADSQKGGEMPHALTDGMLGSDSIRRATWDGRSYSSYAGVSRPVRARPQGGYLIVIRSVEEIDERVLSLTFELIGGVVAISLSILALVALQLMTLSRTLRRIGRGASRFAGGGLDHRLAPPPSKELGELVSSLNTMAEQLSSRIWELSAQRAEQDSLLQSMRAGVLAVSNDRRVLKLNRTGSQMLHCSFREPQGEPIERVVRQSALGRFVADAFAAGDVLTQEIELAHGAAEPMIVRATSSAILGEDDQQLGVIILLTDITQLKKLESMRSDFASNVSHELRTPITNIKGYVETLGEIGFEEEASARKFLGVIDKNVDRLSEIINDLLALTRVERLETGEGLATQPVPVMRLVQDILTQAARTLESKRMRCHVSIDPDLWFMVNERLAGQAVSNLVLNAARYSPQETDIRIDAGPVELQTGEQAIEVRVIDQGPGIEKEHLPRIFERFYRVDKARSRDAGGTGLGLAIVKHIALAHGGQVHVESTVGVGSCFAVAFPVVSDQGDDSGTVDAERG